VHFDALRRRAAADTAVNESPSVRTPDSTSWLFALWRRRRDGSDADAADVGTAFGMELTLLPDEDTAPSAGRPSTAGGRTRWWRRLMRRDATT
jgi:hypothetical protein